MNTTQDTKSKIANLAEAVSARIQKEIEITIRGLRQFTFSFLGNDEKAVARVQAFLGATLSEFAVNYDEELDETFIYFSVKHALTF